MPNGNGWVNEPCDVLEAITAIEIESKAVEVEEMKSRGNNNS